MSLFKFRILDYHKKDKLDENNEIYTMPLIEDGVKSFHLIIDVQYLWIVAFRSDVIIDDENNPIVGTRVYLSDGTAVFAVNNLETFEKNYKNDYLPLFVSK